MTRLVQSLVIGMISLTAQHRLCQADDPQTPVTATPPAHATETARENRLAAEKSPYLLQHKTNPVDWFPWGQEAFDKARRENKPIFLSVGYSTCHWCHVMARESFEDGSVAALLNQHFVSVKLDREERPDIDKIYMSFVQASTGSGGWPMSVFLTPDLKPFYGGTYFPPEDRYGRPGFKTVLNRLAEVWQNQAQAIAAHGDKVVRQLAEPHESSDAAPDGIPGNAAVELGYSQFQRTFDPTHGGFSDAPKFPRPSTFHFLHAYAAAPSGPEKNRAEALRMSLFTLRKMAEGGLHDHLGGGFHRYSVDAVWHIPHFEKMLYDQAQLIDAYLDAWLLSRDPLFRDVVRDTVEYVLRDLQRPDGGGFYSAEDADSLFEHGKPDHGEGVFYVWTETEIDALLGPERAKLFKPFYGVKPEGNAPAGSDPHHEFVGKNTLIVRETVDAAAARIGQPADTVRTALAESRSILFAARAKRPRPHLDDKILTGWNGLALGAIARAGAVLDEPRWIAAATASAQTLQTELWRDGRLYRTYRNGPSQIPAFADDHAFLIHGLLELYEATFDTRWLVWARTLQTRMDALFRDENAGGYFNTESGAAHVLIRMKEEHDSAEPAAGSVAALNLLRLSQYFGDDTLRERAMQTVAAFHESLSTLPHSVPLALRALLAAHEPKPRQIVIAGDPTARDTQALLAETRNRYTGTTLLLLADGSVHQEELSKHLPFLRDLKPVDGKATAYVCENFTCQLPVTTPEALAERLGALPGAPTPR